MRFAKVRSVAGPTVVRIDYDNNRAYPLDLNRSGGQIRCLADLLASSDPEAMAHELTAPEVQPLMLSQLPLAAPVDRQEIWAAGVTYKRSKIAREEESIGAARFYDLVYSADRPELFLKATPERVVDPGHPVRVRKDSRWSVPEPELALMVSPDLRIVGYTIGNDMSSRDIEGENPLYLPQAKIYHGSCSLGPVVTLARSMPPLAEVDIRMMIRRQDQVVFDGSTSVASMNRTPESLVDWLGRENHFPHGVILLTGTGIVPPDDFTLLPGDFVEISISGIGTLANPVQ
jgi:2-dehydro-3-deoxy-D-arabinonate dehydratase